MSIKSILVHVAHDDQHSVRLRMAVRMARQYGGAIDALYVTTPMLGRFGGAGRAASVVAVQEARDTARRHAEEVSAEFDSEVKAAGIEHQWFVVDGEHLDELERQAHLADVVIVSQSEPEFLEDHVRAQIPESLVMLAGCPILLLPRDYREIGSVGENVLVAWNTDPHAARAIRDALPILRAARNVTVLTVGAGGGRGVHPDEVVTYLKRHGVKAETRLDHGGGDDAGEYIVSRAGDIDADMIVMGCFGHSRWREIIFGGATRHVFRNAPVPVFASH